MRGSMTPATVKRDTLGLDGEVVELPVLLPAGQARALVEAASRRGMTVGRLVRVLTQDFLRGPGNVPEALPATP